MIVAYFFLQPLHSHLPLGAQPASPARTFVLTFIFGLSPFFLSGLATAVNNPRVRGAGAEMLPAFGNAAHWFCRVPPRIRRQITRACSRCISSCWEPTLRQPSDWS